MKSRWDWRRFVPLGLIVLVLCLTVVSRWLAWYEWIVGDTPQQSGLGGPRLPRDPLAVPQDSDSLAPQIEYVFGSWQGQDAIPIAMAVYVILLTASGAFCWATLARALPSRTTLEIAYLCFCVGILVWLGVLPLWWFWLLFRSGLVGPILPSSETLVVPLDVTYVRLVLRGPLTLLASVLLSVIAFVWERMCLDRRTDRMATQRA